MLFGVGQRLLVGHKVQGRGQLARESLPQLSFQRILSGQPAECDALPGPLEPPPLPTPASVLLCHSMSHSSVPLELTEWGPDNFCLPRR